MDGFRPCKFSTGCGYEVCVPEFCDAYDPKIENNGDHIRSMDDSNLAIFLTQTAIQGCPYPAMDCEANCKECIQKWLQQPCEEETV